jgi:hypothetical protein
MDGRASAVISLLLVRCWSAADPLASGSAPDQERITSGSGGEEKALVGGNFILNSVVAGRL